MIECSENVGIIDLGSEAPFQDNPERVSGNTLYEKCSPRAE